MKTRIFTYLIAAFVAIQPSIAVTQQPPVIDSSYSVYAFTTSQSMSANRRVEGPPTLFVIFYKAFENNGNPAICGATVGPSAVGTFPRVERFLKRTNVVADDGTVVRTNISRFAFLRWPETPIEERMLSETGEFVPDVKILRSYIGKSVTCVPANRRWKQGFASEGVTLELPSSVRWDG